MTAQMKPLLLCGAFAILSVALAAPQFSCQGYTDEQIERGRYLVNVVGLCSDCHTPRGPDGQPDPDRFLAGGVEFIPGMLWTANITPDPATGIGAWSDRQIMWAIRKGLGHFEDAPQGKPLNPIMPYYVFANLTDEDVQAIVAYLRSGVDPVENEVPERDPSIVPPFPARPLDYEQLPGSGPGKYLTSAAGLCIECHTPRIPSDPPNAAALDPEKYFAGGEEFPIPGFGVVSSLNITPDPLTGIGEWSDDDIKTALVMGRTPEGRPLCPPMPNFGELTPEDLDAIVAFLREIPAIENEVEACQGPM